MAPRAENMNQTNRQLLNNREIPRQATKWSRIRTSGGGSVLLGGLRCTGPLPLISSAAVRQVCQSALASLDPYLAMADVR
jgi:hypothetical protein